MSRSDHAARCRDLWKIYRTPAAEVRALRGITLEVPGGAVTAIVGPSGSGKSSLLRLLAGLDRPSQGSIEIGGLELTRASAAQLRALRRRRVGYVFQRPSDNFVSYLTVGEHLRIASRGSPAPPHPRDVLGPLGLGDRAAHLPAELSGGEQQRAAFAQMLAAGAEIVVADEPTAELDEASAGIVIEHARRLAHAGLAFVLATHDPAVWRAADQVIELEHGRVRQPSPARPYPGMPPAPRTGTGEILLRARSITKHYRLRAEVIHAVREATFDLRRHEIVGLVGRSGSGKTTLLTILAGWEGPDGGDVTWENRSPGPFGWEEVAVIPQHLGLIEELSVRENVALPERMAGRLERSQPAIDDLLDQLGLDHLADRYPAEISVGEQQRAAVARALIVRPQLLLADEPLAHQDAASAGLVLSAIRSAAGDGTCCLLATHNPESVRQADRVIEMQGGSLTPRDDGDEPDNSSPDAWR